MPTELQRRHAKRIEQYAPLVPWFTELLTGLGRWKEQGQTLDITLIWALVGYNIVYVRFHFLVDGHGEDDKPFHYAIQGDQVVPLVREISRILGNWDWNASGMPTFRERVEASSS